MNVPEPAASRLLSVVVPVYNEEEVFPSFLARLLPVLRGSGRSYEIVVVDDGSADGTLALLRRLRADHPYLCVVALSRNFGKEIAMSAGLDHARGEAVVVIDADLQDPPELIPDLVRRYDQGYDVVYARRTHRAGETWMKISTAYGFYRLMQLLSRVKIPADAGDYRLLSRRAVDAISSLRERHRFMKGLFAWVGFRQTAVPYSRDPRAAGRSKWNYWSLWNFAIEGITSFSTGPLKIAAYSGVAIALLSFFYASAIIYKTLVWGDSVRGYPSLMVAVLFLGGIQLMCTGILGEYVGRIFNETKGRPLYLVDLVDPAETDGESRDRS